VKLPNVFSGLPSNFADQNMAHRSDLSAHCLIAFVAAVATVKGESPINYNFGGSTWTGVCQTGTRQSPIDLASSAVTPMSLSPLNLTYEDTNSWTMWASLNYIEVAEMVSMSKIRTDSSTAGNGITMDAYGYTMTGDSAAGMYVPLNQYHFHSPSENTINGVNYPLEMHMVHKLYSNTANATGTLIVATVVAIMFRLDQNDVANPFVDQLLSGPLSSSQYQRSMNSTQSTLLTDQSTQFSLMTSVFNQTGCAKYYAFNGSLTTPGCTEGINWRVLATPLKISRTQLKTFMDVLAMRQGGSARGGDNRDVQPRNARTIMLATDMKDMPGMTTTNAMATTTTTTTVLVKGTFTLGGITNVSAFFAKSKCDDSSSKRSCHNLESPGCPDKCESHADYNATSTGDISEAE